MFNRSSNASARPLRNLWMLREPLLRDCLTHNGEAGKTRAKPEALWSKMWQLCFLGCVCSCFLKRDYAEAIRL